MFTFSFSTTNKRAFTLIELLVVILIIAILVAVALPNFLGQQAKANDSAAQQQLTVAYKNAKSAWVKTGSVTAAYPALPTLLGELRSGEPQLTFVDYNGADAEGTCANVVGSGYKGPSCGPTNISVTVDNAQQVTLCVKSKTDRVFCLRSNETGTLAASSGFGIDSAHAGSTLARSTGKNEPSARAAMDSGVSNSNGSRDWNSSIKADNSPLPKTSITPGPTSNLSDDFVSIAGGGLNSWVPSASGMTGSGFSVIAWKTSGKISDGMLTAKFTLPSNANRSVIVGMGQPTLTNGQDDYFGIRVSRNSNGTYSLGTMYQTSSTINTWDYSNPVSGLAGGSTVWMTQTKAGNIVTGKLYTSDPADGASAVASVTTNLANVGQSAHYGSGVEGYPVLAIDVDSTTLSKFKVQ